MRSSSEMESHLSGINQRLHGILKKHGVSFQQATSAFFDPFLRVVDASPEEEARDAIIGMDENWDLLFVVHIIVEDDRVRIVSARKATRSERHDYED